MATPIFQHGKNAFLAVGYDTSATLATASATASATLTIAGITTPLSGEVPVVNGGTQYGVFVSGVPYVLSNAPAATCTLAAGSQTIASGTCLPLVNLSPYINDISFPKAIESAETTSFGAAGVKTFIVGLKSYTISLAGHYEGSASGIDKMMYDMETFQNTAGNLISFLYGPSDPGTFTGGTASIKYYGNGILTKYDIKSAVGGVVTFDAELQVTGAVTRTTL